MTAKSKRKLNEWGVELEPEPEPRRMKGWFHNGMLYSRKCGDGKPWMIIPMAEWRRMRKELKCIKYFDNVVIEAVSRKKSL